MPGLALWACFFLGNLTLYFLLNWTPTVLIGAGLPHEQAMRAGMLLNLGGGIGMLSLGYLSARWSIYRMMSGYFILGGLFIMALGQVPKADMLFGLTILAGFFALGGLIGLYSLAARLYPDATRSTGIGLAIGAGRFGAILGPYAGGVLISMGWPMGSYFALLALPLIAVAVILWRVRRPDGLA
jgi:AAHS family 4-hydroxybenzoate transporter-like MFS transporter